MLPDGFARELPSGPCASCAARFTTAPPRHGLSGGTDAAPSSRRKESNPTMKTRTHVRAGAKRLADPPDPDVTRRAPADPPQPD